ncbi:phage portal protein [Spartinivicinus ruber]|uniref:phage portal protein n=1 Tax=Spartinivicinus ruber TaxID=2683272 RepID=UPI0015B63CDB|nr:phage portal protein [Spartinivicinus ruber]
MSSQTTQKNKPNLPIPQEATVFSFGDPESVLATHLQDFLGVFANHNGEYYEPPVSLTGLAKLLRANPHHSACAGFKRNMLVKHYKPCDLLPRQAMYRACYDFNVFGNCYFKRLLNPFKQTIRLQHVPAINIRKGVKPDQYYWLNPDRKLTSFKKGEIIGLMEYDVNQQLYGIPEYLSAMHSVLLNESATLFRRRYYDNGAHAGFIFYTNDPGLSPEGVAMMQNKLKHSKGVGNFRSLFLHIPNGNEHSVKIIPVGDIATKDEFERIKNISRNDIISAWRMPPALAGIMPENTGGFGDIQKISQVYTDNEIRPLSETFLQLNEYLSGNQIQFDLPNSLYNES